jgi:hypothetical protein
MQRATRKFVQALLPPSLDDAVKRGAALELTTVAEFTRRALLEKLRANGINPTACTTQANSDRLEVSP